MRETLEKKYRMYESDTEDEKSPDLVGRVLSALAALTFAGGALWIGLTGQEARPSLNAPGPVEERPELSVEMDRLEITGGPRIVREDGNAFIEWTTNEPSDSLVVVEKEEARLQTLAKDATLETAHRFQLPEMPFLDLMRIEVKSASAEGEYVGAEIGPGGGGRWETFEDVTRTHGAAALAPTLTLQWGHLDGDGRADAAACDVGEERADLAVWSSAEQKVVYRRSFRPDGRPAGLRWALLNGDDRQDLLVAGGELTVFWNSGMAQPPMRRRDVVRHQPQSPVAAFDVAELSGDDTTEPVCLLRDGSLEVFRTGSAPLFELARQHSRDAAVREPESGVLIAADFLGDGDVYLCTGGDRLRLFRIGGQGPELQKAAFQDTPVAERSVQWAVAADYDSDADLDLAVDGPAGVLLLRNDGTGRFRDVTGESADLARWRQPVACAEWVDLNRDARPDLLLGPESGGLRLMLNGGGGRFMDATQMVNLRLSDRRRARRLQAVDLDGDGQTDLCTTRQDGSLLLLRNRWHKR
jgi:hypothetical protein